MESDSARPSLLQDLTDAHRHSYHLGRTTLAHELLYIAQRAVNADPTPTTAVQTLVTLVTICKQEIDT